MTESNLEWKKDQMIHMPHNANIMQQIKNDMIINKGVHSQNNIVYYLDNEQLEQSTFLSISLDTIFYVNKIMNYDDRDETAVDELNITYKGYTNHYYKEYKFEPSELNLSFDETDQLVLHVTHPAKGEFYAYGFDKNTGKQGVKPYHQPDFNGSFSRGQNLYNRQIEELRFVLTIADSIYIHDFKIEDFYTHDH